MEQMRRTVLQDTVLSPAQSAKVDTIAHMHHLRIRAMQPVMARASDAERRQALREIADNQVRDIRTVLTADQQQIFDRNRAAWQDSLRSP